MTHQERPWTCSRKSIWRFPKLTMWRASATLTPCKSSATPGFSRGRTSTTTATSACLTMATASVSIRANLPSPFCQSSPSTRRPCEAGGCLSGRTCQGTASVTRTHPTITRPRLWQSCACLPKTTLTCLWLSRPTTTSIHFTCSCPTPRRLPSISRFSITSSEMRTKSACGSTTLMSTLPTSLTTEEGVQRAWQTLRRTLLSSETKTTTQTEVTVSTKSSNG
mmetsp:Transcript_22319/g.55019  ORF Transcript_22319/g.55019 Transcript_22319/m.55019 type:complete len:222 (+) Transcript_22319:480-1145(+)